MENIFDINRYRCSLEAHYVWPLDEQEEFKKERKRQISRYSDEYLLKIIDDTKIFIMYLMNKMESENQTFDGYIFTTIDIAEDTDYISNGCHGGWPSDELYSPIDFDINFRVSRRLLKEFFDGFTIEEETDEYEKYSEIEDAGSIICLHKILICGPIDKYERIRASNILKEEKERELIKVIKMICDKRSKEE